MKDPTPLMPYERIQMWCVHSQRYSTIVTYVDHYKLYHYNKIDMKLTNLIDLHCLPYLLILFLGWLIIFTIDDMIVYRNTVIP